MPFRFMIPVMPQILYNRFGSRCAVGIPEKSESFKTALFHASNADQTTMTAQ